MEDEFVVREKKILSILEQEISDGEEMAVAVRHMAERMLTTEKGYGQSDLLKNVSFEVKLGDETIPSSVDFLVSLDGRDGMVIKCAAGSLSSRERHVVAAARVLKSTPIPIAVVIDPMSAVVLDTATGKVIAEGYDGIPSKQELVGLLAGKEPPKPLAPEKLEREKRVFLAFDAIRCCVPQGGDGGVQLDKAGDA